MTPALLQLLSLAILFSFLNIVVKILFNYLKKKALRARHLWQQTFFDSVQRPLIITLWVIAISYALIILSPLANLQENVALLIQGRTLVIIILATWFVFRWKNTLHQHFRRRGQESTKIDLIFKFATLLVLIIALLLCLDALGVSIGALVALGSIGGLSLGFAAKDVVSNFFGGLTLYFTRPFIVGELIRSSDKPIEGYVEEISWYYTCIRGIDKQPIYVPNALFSSILVTNLTRMSHWVIDERIALRYQDIGAVKSIMDAILALLQGHEKIDQKEPVRVYLDKFASSSLEVVIWACTFAREKSEAMCIKEEILLEIAKKVTSFKAEFAFPTLSLEIIPK